VPFINEAQECLGGIGYVEETMMPRLYRQAPLNSIWEGSGNVQCLDVLRALRKEPETREALMAELGAAKGVDDDYDAALRTLPALFDDPGTMEFRSRFIVERAALMLQASVLLHAGHETIAAAFCRSRLAGAHGLAFGTLPAGAPVDLLIDRALTAA